MTLTSTATPPDRQSSRAPSFPSPWRRPISRFCLRLPPNSLRQRIRALHGWSGDPFARGAYSYALPGRADDRAALAASVDARLFFAGEACSREDFSTAHGAYLTGIAAAEQALEARRR
jgi:monoamine oxidase